MHVGICALLVHPARSGGAETYARRFLAILPEVDSDNTYTVFVAQGNDLKMNASNIRIEVLPAPVENVYQRVLFEQTRLAGYLHRAKFDVVHFLGSTAPWNFRGCGVVSMHDTLRFQQPHLTPWVLGTYYSWIQYLNARSGLAVIAGSNYAATIFRNRLPIKDDSVDSVYYGVDPHFFGNERSGDKEYVLWTGQLYPHKNIVTLLDAYELLKNEGFSLPELRIVGASDSDIEKHLPEVQKRGLSSLVNLWPRIPGHRWLEEFPKLYRNALLYCFPSRYESFGLPILEAMASGTAVIASNLPAHQELYAGKALLIPPTDRQAWAKGLRDLLVDHNRRRAMEQQGIEFARQFTWQKCISQTIAVYQKVAGR